MSTKPKILVIGHSRHGKDTVCEMLQKQYGLNFVSSSLFCAERVVYPMLKGFYQTFEECYNDRHNHRALWFNLIAHYNAKDKARLTREILNEYDIYCGLRNREELMAGYNLFDMVIWVDASKRLPPEPSNSISVTEEDAHVTITNNEDLTALQASIASLPKLFPETFKAA